MLINTGVQALALIARFHRVPVNPEQLVHEYGVPGENFSDTEILRAARAIGFRAKSLKPRIQALSNKILPAIGKSVDGSYFVLVQSTPAEENAQNEVDKDQIKSKWLIQRLDEQAPVLLSRENFLEFWSGELIVLTRRESLSERLQKNFDIS